MKVHLKGHYTTKEVWLNGQLLTPAKSQAFITFLPNKFDWGCVSSATAQLALAILLEIMDKRDAFWAYQAFKEGVIEKLPQADFDQEIELDIDYLKNLPKPKNGK